MTIQEIAALIQSHAAWAIFLILIVSAMGLPIPEEPVLVATGLAIGWASVEWLPALLACISGILAGDVFLYTLGRRFAHSVLKVPPFVWLFTPGNQEKIRGLYARHGKKAIVIGRFFSPLRFGVLVFAGQHRMRFRTFFAIDATSALVYTPLVVLVGVLIASQIPDQHAALSRATALIKDGRVWLLAVGALATVLFVLYTALKKRTVPRSS